MERITNDDIVRLRKTINESLRDGLSLQTQQRNGYTAVDLYDKTGMVDNLHVGSKREVYTYLQGMRRALLITSR